MWENIKKYMRQSKFYRKQFNLLAAEYSGFTVFVISSIRYDDADRNHSDAAMPHTALKMMTKSGVR